MLANWQQAPLDLSAGDCGHPTADAKMREIPEWRLFWTKKSPGLADPFLRDLIACKPVQRLKHVGFLGAIDYLVHGNGRAPHRRRHNRFDHSVNVALLALRYSILRGLSGEETRLLTAAALLHDVGHGPLSHTLEPTFRKLFDIDHHRAGRRIVEGRSPLGDAIPQIFVKHGVDLSNVVAILSGLHGGPHAFLFDSPMNVDTIEAIARCCFFSRSSPAVSPTAFVDAIATCDDFPEEMGDLFWSSKEAVYKTVIGSRSGVVADALAQHYMLAKSAEFEESDFFLDDSQLRSKHSDLFILFETLRNPTSLPAWATPWLSDSDWEVEASVRHFMVNKATHVRSATDLAVRYTQEKTKRKLSLKHLISRQSEAGDQQLL